MQYKHFGSPRPAKPLRVSPRLGKSVVDKTNKKGNKENSFHNNYGLDLDIGIIRSTIGFKRIYKIQTENSSILQILIQAKIFSFTAIS
jgi:hypothetical protein